VIVLDASSWVLALIDRGPVGTAARDVLAADGDWMAPAHTPIEVLRTIRRYETTGVIGTVAADRFAAEVVRAEVRLVLPDDALLTYVWQHRHNVSPYDAPYLGLAARHGVPLVTKDVRLARAAQAFGLAAVVPGAGQ
jgi:predicted nucleic acid-binding protein